MSNFLVPAPKIGQQNYFLCSDGQWKRANETDLFLSISGSWEKITENQRYLKGSGNWKIVDNTPIEENNSAIYLYNDGTLHFSNIEIEDSDNIIKTYQFSFEQTWEQNTVPWYNECKLITRITSDENYTAPVDISFWFSDCINLVDLSGLANWNTAAVRQMNATFSRVPAVTDWTPIAKWSTKKLNSLDSTFANSSINDTNVLKNWDVSEVTNLQNIFQYCNNIQNLDGLIYWDVAQVIYLDSAFYSCSNLINIKGLRFWNTRNVVYMGSCFQNDTSLTDIESLANWNTSNVKYLSNMFRNCKSVPTFIPLNKWNISNVISHTDVFTTNAPRPLWSDNWN